MSKRLDEAEWKLDCLQSRVDAAARRADADDPCWEDYEQRGTKEKGGETVPNCVKSDEAKADGPYSNAEGQKRLMSESFGMKHISGAVNTNKKGDYGADPLGNGMFKMIPSGDVVNYDERQKRLKR